MLRTVFFAVAALTAVASAATPVTAAPRRPMPLCGPLPVWENHILANDADTFGGWTVKGTTLSLHCAVVLFANATLDGTLGVSCSPAIANGPMVLLKRFDSLAIGGMSNDKSVVDLTCPLPGENFFHLHMRNPMPRESVFLWSAYGVVHNASSSVVAAEPTPMVQLK